MVQLMNSEFQGYSGKALNLLKKNKIPVWSKVRVTIDNLTTYALVLPAVEGTTDLIFLKMPNGYNVAFSVDRIRYIEFISREKVSYKIPEKSFRQLSNLPNVTIIGAGGTIASRVEYQTGAVKPAFSTEELANAIPELENIAIINSKMAFNIFSEDMKPSNWIEIAEIVGKEIRSGVDGVVITHGTDTMHFSAAALAFMLENLPIPVVFTGAQRSSDRPSSDAAINLISSVIFASRGLAAEVTLCMHGVLDDNLCYVHRGVRVRKMHSSRRDTFRSIGTPPLASVKDGNIHYLIKEFFKRDPHKEENFLIKAKFDEKTALIYTYPGMHKEILETLIDKGIHGIVIAGTGLGHVPEYILESIRRGIEENVIFVMTTQCLWGPVNMNVYERGRTLQRMGVLSGESMLPETAYVKLGWVLANVEEKKEISKLLLTNLRYEFVAREHINMFFEQAK